MESELSKKKNLQWLKDRDVKIHLYRETYTQQSTYDHLDSDEKQTKGIKNSYNN